MSPVGKVKENVSIFRILENYQCAKKQGLWPTSGKFAVKMDKLDGSHATLKTVCKIQGSLSFAFCWVAFYTQR